MMTDQEIKAEKARQQEAEAFALKAGCKLPVHFTVDAWGGYWQCAGDSSPYNFRLPSKREG